MRKVLIVDDDQMIRELFEELLGSEFMYDQINHAEDGLVAKSKCLSEKYDLILLDHSMPNLDGSAFLEIIRNTENYNKETPVVMVTGFMPTLSSNETTLEKTLYLRKPIDFDKLKRFVKMIAA